MPVEHNDDTYRFSATGYSERSIYGKSVDTRGHYVHKRVNYPPALINSIAIHHKDWGYPTVESFLRDAAVHRLHWWLQNGVELESASLQLSIILAEEAVEQKKSALNDVEKFRDLMMQASGDGEIRSIIYEQMQSYRDNLPSHLKSVTTELDRLLERYAV